MPPIRFLCVCSGISAPTAAWKPRGWQAIAYAEIDPFASAVLAQRHGAGRPRFMPAPDDASDPKEASRRRNAIKALDSIEWGTLITNEGDFTRLRDEPMIVEADVLVGGTPCQAFSLAGLRRSLADDRGNLSLEFLRLADAIDDLRRAAGKPPVAILWENVPGVLSVADNAFGAFLAGMVGAQSALVPQGKGGWTSAGVAAGPRRVAAWRSLDAQFFGLPQRRRRVFVLARGGAGALRVADALLPVIDSLCGHPAPSRQPREASPPGAGARAERSGGANGGVERGGVGGAGGGGRPQGDGGRSVQRVAFGGNRTGGPIEVAAGLLAKPGSGIRQDFESDTFVVEEPMPFDPTQITHPENRSKPAPGDPAPTLARTGHPPAIAFSAKDDGGDADEIAPTLRSMNWHKTHANGGGQIAVAYAAPVAGALQSGGFKTPGSATGQDAETGLLIAYAPETAAPIVSGTHQAGPRTTDVESGALVVNLEHGLAPHGSLQLKDVSDEITASEGKGHSVVIAHAFSLRGRDGENMIEPEDGDVAPAIRTGGGGSDKPFVAYAIMPAGHGQSADLTAREVELAPTLDGTSEAEATDRGLRIVEAVAFQERRRPEGVAAEWNEDQSYALTAPTGGGRAQERLIAVAFKPSHYTRDKDGAPSEIAPALSADADKGDQDPLILQEDAKAFTVSGQANGFAWESDVNPAILAHPQSDTSQLQYGVRIGTAVRRLTPRECERLQGFEDDFTLIPYSDAHRSEDDLAETLEYLRAAGYDENEARVLAATPDGPRYRALGNSQAVKVIEDLGAKIEWLLEEGGW